MWYIDLHYPQVSRRFAVPMAVVTGRGYARAQLTFADTASP